MNISYSLCFSLLMFAICTNTYASQENDTDESEAESAAFLEYLAEVEEATGDGFDDWIKAESDNCETNTLIIPEECSEK